MYFSVCILYFDKIFVVFFILRTCPCKKVGNNDVEEIRDSNPGLPELKILLFVPFIKLLPLRLSTGAQNGFLK